MRPSKETKPNKGFKMAFRAGILIIVILSVIISWISVSIISSIGGEKSKVDPEKENSDKEWTDVPDTFYIEKTKEIVVRDTVYKYVQPAVPAKPKQEEMVAPKRDTLPK